MKPYLSLAFSAWTEAYMSVHYSPQLYSGPWNDGTKGELQMERGPKSKLEGIAAVGQTSWRASHAKMLAPLEKTTLKLETDNY